MYVLYEYEYRIFKPVEITIRRGLYRKEKNRGDEPIQVVILAYMEMSHETPCTAISNKQKCFVLFCFQKQRIGRQNRSCLGAGTSGRRKDIRKGCRRVNMVEILCTHVCKWKNETCRNDSRNRGREDKGE
jgi:hypothetical protein